MNTRIGVSRYAIGPLMLASGLALFASLFSNRPASAAPWDLIRFKHVDADPNNPYPVTETVGPWMIMVTTFQGDDARQQAQQLVYELRKRENLVAYTHVRNYNYDQKDMYGRGIDEWGAPKRMKYVHEERIVEVAVLVGDFRSADDPDAQKQLSEIKRFEPACMKPVAAPTDDSTVAELRRWFQQTSGIGERKNGPLANAFITTNPLLPREYFVGRGVDRFVMEMNKGVEYSLLDCPGRYSVRIANFTGRVEINQEKIREYTGGTDRDDQNDESPLVMAAAKAHAVTKYLRAHHVEAYEFHDRSSSIVTVGHFNSVGTQREDGKIEINPQIYEIIRQFGADQNSLMPGQMMMGVKAKTIPVPVGKLKEVVLDVTPIPIEVPRRSISAQYQASTMR